MGTGPMSQAVHTVGDICVRNAWHFGSRESVIQGELRLTHRELNRRVNRLAHGLRSLGVKPGDRVALLARNHYRFVEIYFGLAKLGAIFVPLDFWSSKPELSHALDLCAAESVIVSGSYLEIILAIQPSLLSIRNILAYSGDVHLPPGVVDYEELLAGSDDTEPAFRPKPDDDVLILFTSGSTGKSKAAVYTHRALLNTANAMALEYAIRETDITLHFLPMFSSNLEHLLPLAYMGATHVVLPRFDPALVWETVERERITHFDAIPTTMRFLLDDPGKSSRDLSSLSLVTYASEPMPPSLIRSWLEHFPHCEAVQFYGMIEFLCITVQQPWAQIGKIGTVGRPHIGTEVKLVNANGAQVPIGEVGEVLARSPCGMRGYWKDAETTSRVLVDGWMITGDLAQFDEDGFLTLIGRKKEFIITGGMTVSPFEVETVIKEHPSVEEVAVIGVPDEKYGEAVQATIALKPGMSLTEQQLLDFCAERLAGYKKPKGVVFLDSLPKTGIGKVDKKALLKRNGK